MRTKLLYGFLENDAEYGETVNCPYYLCYKNMALRCHKNKSLSVNPVWLKFSKFKMWMKAQKWEGLSLDKDIILPGNKEYGPDTCAFVPARLNNAFLTLKPVRGDLPLGVYYQKKNKGCMKELTNPYRARVQNSLEGKVKTYNIGYFPDPFSAHKAWQVAKKDYLISMLLWYRSQPYWNIGVDRGVMLRIEMLEKDILNNMVTETLYGDSKC